MQRKEDSEKKLVQIPMEQRACAMAADISRPNGVAGDGIQSRKATRKLPRHVEKRTLMQLDHRRSSVSHACQLGVRQAF